MAIIKLTTCDSVIEAGLIKNKLENEDIKCFLTNEISTTLLPGYVGMMNAGIQVMIQEEDYEKAYRLIDKPESEKTFHCPNCNSTNIYFGFGKNKFNKYFLLFLALFSLSPVGRIKAIYHCNVCKCEF